MATSKIPLLGDIITQPKSELAALFGALQTSCGHCGSNTAQHVYIELIGLPQVWNSNAVKDEFMGQVVLSGSPEDSPDPQVLQLRKRGQQMADEMPGHISLRIVTSTQLTAM